MRRLLSSTLLAAAAASAAVVLAASSASAATFSVTGAAADGTATGVAGATTLTTPRTQLRCTSATAHAINLVNGTSSGQPIANIDRLNFNNCTLGGLITFSVDVNADQGADPTDPNHTDPVGGPWNLNALSESPTDQINGRITPNPVGGVIVAHIHGINATCEADVTGSLVPVTYTNPDHTLHIPGTGQNLTVSNVVQCGNLISNGEAASFSGNFSINPAVVIKQTS